MGESLGAARRRLASLFAAAGIESADLDARILVCAAARIGHADLVRDMDRLVEPSAAGRLETYAARRLRREPVSRILGRREFWGLELAVSPAVLDPRPETEGLVASALDAIGGRRTAPLRILDLGVGSGAILVALLKELPCAWGLGVDASEPACRLALANLARHGVGPRAGMICGDWAAAIRGPFDLVVSNPPYIASDELRTLDEEVRIYDPPPALDGGHDGLGGYRAIIPSLGSLVAPEGTVCLECGAGQGHRVASLLDGAGFAGGTVYKDLAGHDRVVVALRAAHGLSRGAPSRSREGIGTKTLGLFDENA